MKIEYAGEFRSAVQQIARQDQVPASMATRSSQDHQHYEVWQLRAKEKGSFKNALQQVAWEDQVPASIAMHQQSKSTGQRWWGPAMRSCRHGRAGRAS